MESKEQASTNFPFGAKCTLELYFGPCEMPAAAIKGEADAHWMIGLVRKRFDALARHAIPYATVLKKKKVYELCFAWFQEVGTHTKPSRLDVAIMLPSRLTSTLEIGSECA